MFPEVEISEQFLYEREHLFLGLSFALAKSARANRSLTDRDLISALTSLAKSYQTLVNSSLIYEQRTANLEHQAITAEIEQMVRSSAFEQKHMGVTRLWTPRYRSACFAAGLSRTSAGQVARLHRFRGRNFRKTVGDRRTRDAGSRIIVPSFSESISELSAWTERRGADFCFVVRCRTSAISAIFPARIAAPASPVRNSTPVRRPRTPNNRISISNAGLCLSCAGGLLDNTSQSSGKTPLVSSALVRNQGWSQFTDSVSPKRNCLTVSFADAVTVWVGERSQRSIQGEIDRFSHSYRQDKVNLSYGLMGLLLSCSTPPPAGISAMNLNRC